jgi:UPF0755 protein
MSAFQPSPETRPRGPWRRPGRWLAVVLVGALLALAAVEAGRALIPPAPLRASARTVEIPPGQGVLDVGRILVREGVIRSQVAFVALAVVRGTARSLKAGEYEIPRGASLLRTLSLLELGRVRPHLVVVKEGFTVRDIARVLQAEGIAPAADVLRLAADPAFAQSLGVDADRLEGYLFPDTYQMTRGMRVEDVVGRMVQRLRDRVVTPEVLRQAQALGLNLHGLLTLASIIEKEAAVPEERTLIAAVFWNRLRRGMPLQADPTVSYAVGKDGRAPTRDDLLVDHPFNTYRYRGLPPGPIASPGHASIEAALNPAPVPYLYFVSIDDRRHHFSTTLEEHNVAVTRYWKRVR